MAKKRSDSSLLGEAEDVSLLTGEWTLKKAIPGCFGSDLTRGEKVLAEVNPLSQSNGLLLKQRGRVKAIITPEQLRKVAER